MEKPTRIRAEFRLFDKSFTKLDAIEFEVDLHADPDLESLITLVLKEIGWKKHERGDNTIVFQEIVVDRKVGQLIIYKWVRKTKKDWKGKVIPFSDYGAPITEKEFKERDFQITKQKI